MAFHTQRHVDSTLENLDSSVEMSSPSPLCSIQPRKLRFADDDYEKKISPSKKGAPFSVNVCISPPYRSVRALRLFDTPATPKTILQKSAVNCANHLSGVGPKLSVSLGDTENFFKNVERPRSLPLHNLVMNQQQSANINPFTPNSLLAHNKKRCRTQFGREYLTSSFNGHVVHNSDNKVDNEWLQNADDDTEVAVEMHQAPKRLALHDTNISRYRKEFIEVSLIGVGEFGLVYQCVNRLDGCIYAIKRSIKPVAGSSFEKRALNEVWAHAVLGKHDNVVRYYSAWAEDDHMLIQNEYCNGGSLHALIQKRFLVESELRILLLHVAEGLRYIHSNDLVHMDLKSGNIFLTKVPSVHKTKAPPSPVHGKEDDGMDVIYEELQKSENIITYKIGDLGHVTSVKEPHVEEGDCRYLPNEILQENYKDLHKADIFSLGVTLFEAAGGGPLPKNGPEWHKLRNGEVPPIPTLSNEFNELIQLMTHPDPEKRPSSTSIFNHSILNSLESKSKSQLSQELAIEKRKNEILLRKLRECKKTLKEYEHHAKTHNMPQSLSEKRCLRSFTRKLRTPCHSNSKLDPNKNVVNNFQY